MICAIQRQTFLSNALLKYIKENFKRKTLSNKNIEIPSLLNFKTNQNLSV